jgi:predicted HicB family RNase H-like nuclease
MASEGEVWVQLATRIPKHLHRELKLHCVKSDVSVMEFVVKALEEKLQRESGGRGERRRARA